MRAAVYTGTRNLYPHMVAAAKSLAANSSVEKIFFLIEDDEFPEALPPLVETINVSGQKWFPADGPNMKSQFTYMAMVRACLTKILPADLDRVLSLDVDTVVADNIDELWGLDMDRKWFAMAEEKYTTRHVYGIHYYNAGVAVFNLAEIRKDKADDDMVKMLNEDQMPYIDQDAMNRLGYPRKILEIPVRFNECMVNGFTEHPAIVHYAGFRDGWTNPLAPRREYYAKYRDMTWEQALKGRDSGEAPKPEKKPARRKTAKKAEA